MRAELTLRLRCDLAELERMNMAVEEFLEGQGTSFRQSYHIRLALDELVTNTISYGYDSPDGHEIVLVMAVADGEAVITLEDDARPFNPLDAPEPDLDAPLEERQIGGLGVHFVRKTMDRVEYERAHGKNVLRLMKHLG